MFYNKRIGRIEDVLVKVNDRCNGGTVNNAELRITALETEIKQMKCEHENVCFKPMLFKSNWIHYPSMVCNDCGKILKTYTSNAEMSRDREQLILEEAEKIKNRSQESSSTDS